jgi:hypothetical protein
MPIETTEALNIVCDNPDCPGNDLDPANRKGWLFISSEYYAEGTVNQHVFCCADCCGTSASNHDHKFAEKPEYPIHPGMPMTPVPPSEEPAPEEVTK